MNCRGFRESIQMQLCNDIHTVRGDIYRRTVPDDQDRGGILPARDEPRV